MRDEVFLLGRILFAMILIGSGIGGHLMDTESSTQYAISKKLPNARIMVQVSGVALALGGAAIILGVWLDLAGLLAAILVLIIAFMMHRFWEETEPQAKQVEMSMFMKNLSIAGGGLILAAVGTFAPYTITDGVF
jgi:uncharacterized membrane protein YphA (DoxX/SURF4 family)